MSPRSLLVGVLALVFGGSAAMGVKQLVQAPKVAPAETVPVVVAVVDIPRGQMIAPELIAIREFPRGGTIPGSIARIEDVQERTALVPMVKDEPVLETKLATKGAGRGMAAIVPVGMRAFTIDTPGVASGVAGFILPGNKVDVLLTMEAATVNGKQTSVTNAMLQNLEILAVDQIIEAPAENKVTGLRSVTLLVTPDQANKLTLAQTKGTLHLSLRNVEDDAPTETRPAMQAELLGFSEVNRGEQIKGFLGALGAVLAQRPRPTAPPAAAPTPAPQPKRYLTIIHGPRGMERIPTGGTPGQVVTIPGPQGGPTGPAPGATPMQPQPDAGPAPADAASTGANGSPVAWRQ